MSTLFEIKTLLLTTVLVNLVIASLLIFYWKKQQTYPGFGFWTASHAIGSVTYLLYVLRGQIPEFVSVVVSGTLVAFFGTLRLEGIRLFVAGSWKRTSLILYPLLLSLPLFYFSQVDDNIFARTIALNLMLAAILSQILALLVPRARQPGQAIYWAPVFFFGAFIGLLLLRIGVWVLAPEARGLFAASIANNTFFLVLLLHDIGIAVSYLMLNTKRHSDELHQAQSHLQTLNATLQNQVRLETEKRLVQERLLAHNARLAAMGEMVGVIAHQWRQPLTTLGMILQRLELQQQRGELDAAVLAAASQAGMRQIQAMSTTIDDFRSFYSPDRSRVTFSVCDKLREAVALVESSFTASDVTLEVDCQATGCPPLHGFPNQFVQAILNLLNNARDAVVSAGRAGAPGQGRVSISARTERERLIVTVTDNGCGVPAALGESIFESFVTSKESAGGTGIGLYLTRTIVEDSFGGRIAYRSRPGETVFTLELPLGGEERHVSA